MPLAEAHLASFTNCSQILHQADFTIPVEIEGNYHNVYVIKRPGVDQFMKRVGELYEVVVFTASVSKVCAPLAFSILRITDMHNSMVTRFWTNWTYTVSSTTGCSERAAITMAVTM